MGGWNYNCFPYLYARYSVGGYGNNTPNYWKIEKFGSGDIDKCVPENQFCYVCEPPSENTTLRDFEIFPEPEHSDTWQQAVKYVEAHANSSYPPKWNYDMVRLKFFLSTDFFSHFSNNEGCCAPLDGPEDQHHRDGAGIRLLHHPGPRSLP